MHKDRQKWLEIWENMKQKYEAKVDNFRCDIRCDIQSYTFENKEKSLYSKVGSANWFRYFTNIVLCQPYRHYRTSSSKIA